MVITRIVGEYKIIVSRYTDTFVRCYIIGNTYHYTMVYNNGVIYDVLGDSVFKELKSIFPACTNPKQLEVDLSDCRFNLDEMLNQLVEYNDNDFEDTRVNTSHPSSKYDVVFMDNGYLLCYNEDAIYYGATNIDSHTAKRVITNAIALRGFIKPQQVKSSRN